MSCSGSGPGPIEGWIKLGLALCCIHALGLGCDDQQQASPAVDDTSRSAPSAGNSQGGRELPSEVAQLLVRVVEDPEFPCRHSYQQSLAVLEHNPPHLENPELPRIEQASEEVYMADCGALPLTVQRCMVFEYAFLNRSECKQARAEHDAFNAAKHGGQVAN